MKFYDGYLTTEYVDQWDWPSPGEVYIALDLQNRLGPSTWLVGLMGNGTHQGDTVQLGLFWQKKYATHFAYLYKETINPLAT